MPLLLLLVVLGGLLAAWPSASAAERHFGGWRVDCSGHVCTARAQSDGAGIQISRSTGPLERDAGEGALWAVSFDLPFEQPEPRVALRLGDGSYLYLEQPYGVKPFGSAGRHYLAEEALLVSLLAELAKVPRLSVSYNERYEIEENPSGATWHVIDIANLDQALEHIDQVQNMPHSLRIADMPRWLKPATPGVEAPDLPVDVKTAHFHSGGCNPVRHDNPVEVTAFEAHVLSDSETLYLIECNLYAYNSDARAYIAEVVDGKVASIETIAVPVFLETGWGASVLIPSGSFDPDTDRLFGYHKGRGIGDCGGTDTWRYAGHRGFVLIESRYKACTSEPAGDGDDTAQWPVVYRLGLDDVSILNTQTQE